MTAPDQLLYEYAMIRFVPRIDREEFINIGLIMMNKRIKWLKALVTFDEKKIAALAPGSDINCLKNQAGLFEMDMVPSPDLPVEEKYRWLTAVKSACLQVSPSHPAILVPKEAPEKEDVKKLMEEEFERLFNLLVL